MGNGIGIATLLAHIPKKLYYKTHTILFACSLGNVEYACLRANLKARESSTENCTTPQQAMKDSSATKLIQ